MLENPVQKLLLWGRWDEPYLLLASLDSRQQGGGDQGECDIQGVGQIDILTLVFLSPQRKLSILGSHMTFSKQNLEHFPWKATMVLLSRTTGETE